MIALNALCLNLESITNVWWLPNRVVIWTWWGPIRRMQKGDPCRTSLLTSWPPCHLTTWSCHRGRFVLPVSETADHEVHRVHRESIHPPRNRRVEHDASWGQIGLDTTSYLAQSVWLCNLQVKWAMLINLSSIWLNNAIWRLALIKNTRGKQTEARVPASSAVINLMTHHQTLPAIHITFSLSEVFWPDSQYKVCYLTNFTRLARRLDFRGSTAARWTASPWVPGRIAS